MFKTLPENLSDLPENPYDLFALWMKDAHSSEINDPTAACLATVSAEGQPRARMVLAKSFDHRGFCFHTNTESTKGRDINANPKAALCFHWKSLRRQVRIEGAVQETTPEEADAYFATRSRESRIGAWASQQSRPLARYEDLTAAQERYTREFEGREDIPRPPYWKGFRLAPSCLEFWIDGEHRLHRRFVYALENGRWSTRILYP